MTYGIVTLPEDNYSWFYNHELVYSYIYICYFKRFFYWYSTTYPLSIVWRSLVIVVCALVVACSNNVPLSASVLIAWMAWFLICVSRFTSHFESIPIERSKGFVFSVRYTSKISASGRLIFIKVFVPSRTTWTSPVVILLKSIPALTTHSTVIIILSSKRTFSIWPSISNPNNVSERSFCDSNIFVTVIVALLSLLVDCNLSTIVDVVVIIYWDWDWFR